MVSARVDEVVGRRRRAAKGQAGDRSGGELFPGHHDHLSFQFAVGEGRADLEADPEFLDGDDGVRPRPPSAGRAPASGRR
jgi:hypothetical protein